MSSENPSNLKTVIHTQGLIDIDEAENEVKPDADILNRLPWQAEFSVYGNLVELSLTQDGMNDEVGYRVTVAVNIKDGAPCVQLFNSSFGDQICEIKVDANGAEITSVIDEDNNRKDVIDFSMYDMEGYYKWQEEQRRRLIAESAGDLVADSPASASRRPKI